MDYSNNKENRNCPKLIVVVPCYNEEAIIEKSASVLSDKLRRLIKDKKISPHSRILFVDDGSFDSTFRIIYDLCHINPTISILKLAGNSGHQNAVLAGMMTAKEHCDIVITIDADLQQDIEVLDQFIDKFRNGCEVVYGVRNDRSSDSWFKKTTASLYYRIMKLLGSDVIPNHADYRLMSRKALNALSGYSESNLFLRGLIPQMGFTSDIVYFDVKERDAGTSKYTLRKMLTLAMDGITSFSIRPLHLIGLSGFIVVFLGIIMTVIVLIDWSKGLNVPGYTTLLIIMLIATGAILISLGVIGEYIAKIYIETKRRPHYIIDSVIWQDPDHD